MKKYFFFAAAAIAMLASCQKSELKSEQTPVVDDSTPVAMQIGATNPTFAVTKAAVNAWAETPVFIYGLQHERGADLQTTGNYEAVPIINAQEATVVDATTPLVLWNDDKDTEAVEEIPYYYAEGQTYDFFGYHTGNATFALSEGNTANVYAYDVTFDGSNDVMYAYTLKNEDIKKDTYAQVTEGDVYSAWAARRNVQPNLVFKHALTRFNFIVKGMNANSANVSVQGVSVVSANTGKLTVVNSEYSVNAEGVATGLGFVPAALAEGATEPVLNLKDEKDAELAVAPVQANKEFYLGGQGASLMVAPDMASIAIKVDLWNNKDDKDLPDYNFTAKATEVREKGSTTNAGITKFEAGHAYNIYINVYGPEEIIITAELTPWVDGGDYTYDPDTDRPGGAASTFVNARLMSMTASSLTYGFDTSDDITNLQATLGGVTKDVALSKGYLHGTVTFDNLTTGEIYTLTIAYKTDSSQTEYTDAGVEIQAAPSEFNVTETWLVNDETSYGKLGWNDWSKYQEDLANYNKGIYDPEQPFDQLPWLAARFSETKCLNVVASCGNFTWSNTYTTSAEKGFTTLTLCARELGLTELLEGVWTLTLNGVEKTVEVPAAFAIDSSWVVCDKASYLELGWGEEAWAAYENDLAQYEAGNYDPAQPFDALPWLAVKFTPSTEINVTASCGSYVKELKFSSEKEFELLTLCARELGVEEIKAGDVWYVTINGVQTKIVYPTAE